jgi:hypothetical protein
MVCRFRSNSLLLILVLTSACSDPTPRGQTDAVVPRWSGVVDLAIDSLNGKSDEFGVATGVTADKAGRVFVADGRLNTLSAFDSTGRLLYAIGRDGAGPGEFKQPCCLAVDAQGLLWVRDAGNGRYNRYQVSDTGARFLGQVPMPSGAVGYQAPLTFDAQGRLVDVGTAGPSGIVRLHVDSTGHVVSADSLAGPSEDSLGQRRIPQGSSTGYLYQPYGPTFTVGHAPGGGWARGVSSHYLVRWVVDGDAGRAVTVRRDMIGPALSARERSIADAELTAAASRLGLTGSAVPFGVPGSKTPVQGIMFDQQGRLWVQLSVADGQVNRADVYDKTGRRIGNAEWPSNVDLTNGFISDRTAYGIRRDSLGVPVVVRVRFR